MTARKQKNATIEMLGARLTGRFTASIGGKMGKMGAGVTKNQAINLHILMSILMSIILKPA